LFLITVGIILNPFNDLGSDFRIIGFGINGEDGNLATLGGISRAVMVGVPLGVNSGYLVLNEKDPDRFFRVFWFGRALLTIWPKSRLEVS
jgi:hypothetical protein